MKAGPEDGKGMGQASGRPRGTAQRDDAGRRALATAHNAVDEARDDVASNTEHLEDLMAPADPLLIRSKERELALAETALVETEAFLAGLRERLEMGLALDLPVAAPGTGEGIDSTMLDDVSESLRMELLAAQRKIEDALLDLREAEESLDPLAEPSDPVLVALREAQLATAELEVEAALQRLEGATLTSPIAGIVTGIAVRAGEYVERGALAMTVVDSTVMEVHGAVDETGVLHVQVGAHANVLLRALPGRSLSGAVSYVSPTANNMTSTLLDRGLIVRCTPTTNAGKYRCLLQRSSGDRPRELT